jgi:PAS domain S-box-containing protein
MYEPGSISRHLLEFSPDALIVVDLQGQIVFANPTAHRLFGYGEGALVGRPLEQLVPERYRIRHGAHLTSFRTTPSNREMGARLVDLFARRADGTEFPAGIRLAPFEENGRMLVGAAIRDMTERRAINDALVAAREEAERANHAKTRFLATASHDLRQPLQTIRLLNASLLNLTSNAQELHRLLEQQAQAIDGASRLLDALLDITRLESGSIEPELATVSLGTMFGELAREFEPMAREKGLRLELPAAGAAVSTDRILLLQLLQNLIGNAIKYTDDGRVGLTEVLDEGGLTLTVEDTGVGIPEEKLERIFDEYYQVDHKGKQRSGVGLGLAIVRELARILGYSVSISSRIDEGTKVRVRIPAEQVLVQGGASIAHGGAAERAARSAEVVDARHRAVRIVLVEDNDSVRMATELFLSLEGYEVLCAASVADAEPLLTAMRPGDLLISDYHLDGAITGLQVLEQLRNRAQREVPAILLTGDLQSMLRVVKGEIPCCRFLSKPVDTHALIAAIAELTRGPADAGASAA